MPDTAPALPPAVSAPTAAADDRRVHPSAVLVVNASSRRASRVRPRLPGLLRSAGLRMLDDVTVVRPAALPTALAAALDLDPDLLVVGGGDGTLTTAAALLAHRRTALGVLPLGTTNNFARSLGLPLTLRAAVRTLATGRVVDVDLGRLRGPGVEDVLFANLVSLGVSVEVARRAPRALKRRLGRAAYAATALTVLPGHAPFTATLTTATTAASRRIVTHQLNIANGRFHAGRPLAREASLDDRRLHVYQLGGARRLGLVAAVVRQALTGARRSHHDDAFLVASSLEVVSDPPLALDVDGEVLGRTPVVVEVVDGALRVVVPRR